MKNIYVVQIQQDDTSTWVWSLTKLVTYLKSILKGNWGHIEITYPDTRIVINKIK